MNQLLSTLRHRPGPLIGTFVALTLAAMLVTITASLVGTGLTLTVPAQRLAAATVIVTGNENIKVTSGKPGDRETDVLPLPTYRRVPANLATRLAAIPGVASAVADVSFPVAIVLPDGQVTDGTAASPLTGYSWHSAGLTPFRLTSGHGPADSQQVVVGAGMASAAGLRVGERIRLAGQDLSPFTVVGIAAAPSGNPAGNWTLFFAPAQAAALYGHSGAADLIGVVARPGMSASLLAARVRHAVAGQGLTVLSGTARGQAEDLAAAGEKANLWQLAASAGIDVVLIALFVVAGAVALSVALRWRNIALLRAIGATPGQLRRDLALELAVLGGLAGLAGFVPGIVLASLAIHGMIGHLILPSSTRVWVSGWTVLITLGIGTIVAQLAGFVAARRASRISPTAALTEASIERRWPNVLRILFGLAGIGGGVALCITSLLSSVSAFEQLNLALAMLLSLMAGVAFLAPVFVILAELLLRMPIRLLGGVTGRLAIADIQIRPRRMASAVVAVMLAVTFVGAIYLIDATQTHAAGVQGRQRLTAEQIVTVPGPGLSPAARTAIAASPGVKAAIGLTPTTVFVPDPGNDQAAGEAVTGGSVDAVLNLKVVAGSLRQFGPGDIALSSLLASKGAVGVKVGGRITAYLADGTPYRATVTAIYSRSLGFADVVIPAAAAGGGHLGTTSLGQILVQGSGSLVGSTPALAGRFPGLSTASRSVVNAQAQQATSQTSYANDLLIALIALLAAVALVNTLVMATSQRREALRLLDKIGATTRQMLSVTGWQTVVLSAVGIVLGVITAAAPVLVAAKALTGTWSPYVTAPPIIIIVIAVLILTWLAIFAPTARILAAPAAE
jgi:putative ABC transport system permease protein